ncbi:unnamed protein product [Brachionus calyciflorus]|uniref:Uncharacterized protein n=1 Tax=Brachionus calyciflorus TaxID=104777 RepID=A0A814AZU1_9BILA|nr:unnamed protein product [Brachionus calyciflorus]
MIAVSLKIPNPKHQFHHLQDVPYSVDIDDIQDPSSKEEIVKESILSSFPIEYENKILVVQAQVESNKFFFNGLVNDDIKSGNNGVLEKSISSINETIVQLNRNVTKINEDNAAGRKFIIGIENDNS